MDHRLQVSPTAVSLAKKNGSDVAWSVAWDDICNIVAFKVDLFTFDRIYMGIGTEAEADKEERDRWYHLCHEELRGWPILMQAIETRYGSSAVKNVNSLLFPPFQELSIVVWERDSVSNGVEPA